MLLCLGFVVITSARTMGLTTTPDNFVSRRLTLYATSSPSPFNMFHFTNHHLGCPLPIFFTPEDLTWNDQPIAAIPQSHLTVECNIRSLAAKSLWTSSKRVSCSFRASQVIRDHLPDHAGAAWSRSSADMEIAPDFTATISPRPHSDEQGQKAFQRSILTAHANGLFTF